MDMDMQILPSWVTPVAIVFVVLSVLCAAAVAYDIYGRGHRQPVRIMEAVWVLSALWLGPFVLPLYAVTGRRRSTRWQAAHPGAHAAGLPLAAAAGGLAGGAASLVGHVIGVPLVLATGLSLFGVDMFAMIAVIAVLAVLMLLAFEFAVRGHLAREASAGAGLGTALLVAVVTVVAFDLGMGGWMLLLHFGGYMPPVTSVSFLFLMQVGIVLGFITGYPAVALLLRRGTKVAT